MEEDALKDDGFQQLANSVIKQRQGQKWPCFFCLFLMAINTSIFEQLRLVVGGSVEFGRSVKVSEESKRFLLKAGFDKSSRRG